MTTPDLPEQQDADVLLLGGVLTSDVVLSTRHGGLVHPHITALNRQRRDLS